MSRFGRAGPIRPVITTFRPHALAGGGPVSATSYRVILSDVTDVNGIVQNTTFNFITNLDVVGRVRKGTSAPRYITAPLSGTITEDGLDLSAFLAPDD